MFLARVVFHGTLRVRCFIVFLDRPARGYGYILLGRGGLKRRIVRTKRTQKIFMSVGEGSLRDNMVGTHLVVVLGTTQILVLLRDTIWPGLRTTRLLRDTSKRSLV
jgi:hypothetical protein